MLSPALRLVLSAWPENICQEGPAWEPWALHQAEALKIGEDRGHGPGRRAPESPPQGGISSFYFQLFPQRPGPSTSHTRSKRCVDTWGQETSGQQKPQHTCCRPCGPYLSPCLPESSGGRQPQAWVPGPRREEGSLSHRTGPGAEGGLWLSFQPSTLISQVRKQPQPPG